MIHIDENNLDPVKYWEIPIKKYIILIVIIIFLLCLIFYGIIIFL